MSPELAPAPFPGARLLPGSSVDDLLGARGFVGAGSFLRHSQVPGLTVRRQGRWLVLAEAPEASALPPALPAALGQPAGPGLWKWASGPAGPERRFEIPIWALADDGADAASPALRAPASSGLAPILDWALATRLGHRPAGWNPPPADLVNSWLRRGGLTVQTRGHVRQGELCLTSARWAVRMPILPEVHMDLAPARRRALLAIAAEAQARWAMVRLGLAPASPADPAALSAEVDLTGAPPDEGLFSASVDVLRHVVVSLVETVEVLGDPTIPIASLALDDHTTTTPTERKQP